MPWFSPRASRACLSMLAALTTSACGRFGFERVPLDGDARGPATSAPPSGTDAAPGQPSGAGAAGDGGVASGGATGGGNGAGDDASVAGPVPDAEPVAPPADAGPAAVDGALPAPDLTPLPANIDCSSFTGLIACDNFSGSTSGTSVRTASYGGTAVTDEIASLSISTEMTGANVAASFMPIMSGALYLRFSAFVPSGFAIDGINLASIGNLADTGDFGLDLNLVRDGEVELKTSGDGAVNSGGSYTLPRDRWLCVLLKVESIDGSAGTAALVVDGADIIRASNLDTSPPGGVMAVSAGIDWSFFGQGPAAVYVDNFVLTRDHPGACP